MQQEANILGVVKNSDLGGSLLGPAPVLGLPGIHSLQDAQPPEVVQGELKLPESCSPTNILSGLAGFVLELNKVLLNVILSKTQLEITLHIFIGTPTMYTP